MAKNKTVATIANVSNFLNKVKDEVKRKDSKKLIQLMKSETGHGPRMWGPGIIGFGTCHYKYESGREGDMPIVGFSPRSTAIVLYLSAGFEGRKELLKKFGKHKTGKGCIYVKKLDDVNASVLQRMIRNHIGHIRKAYPAK